MVADAAALQAALDANDVVNLAAGSTVVMDAQVAIPANTRLTTSRTNPAILQRSGSVDVPLVVTGQKVKIEWVICDYNMDGTWRGYNSCIAFNATGPGLVDGNISGLRIVGVQFLDLSPGGTGTHDKFDSWAISATPGVAGDVDDVKILGCRSVGDWQLVGNGSLNGKWSNIEIAGCIVDSGFSAGFGISSKTSTAEGNGITTFENLNIHHNVFRRCNGIGVFVGQDGSEKPDGTVQINNLNISDNIIHLRSGGTAYPVGVLIRPGTEAGYTATATVDRNLIITKYAPDGGGNPAVMSFQGNSSGNTLNFRDNIRAGGGSVTLFNVAATYSGNTNIDNSTWNP